MKNMEKIGGTNLKAYIRDREFKEGFCNNSKGKVQSDSDQGQRFLIG